MLVSFSCCCLWIGGSKIWFQVYSPWNASSILDSSHWFHSSCVGMVLSDGIHPSMISEVVCDKSLNILPSINLPSSGWVCHWEDGSCIGRGLLVLVIINSSFSSATSSCSSCGNVGLKFLSSTSDELYK